MCPLEDSQQPLPRSSTDTDTNRNDIIQTCETYHLTSKNCLLMMIKLPFRKKYLYYFEQEYFVYITDRQVNCPPIKFWYWHIRYISPISDVWPTVHSTLRPLHRRGLRAHLSLALWVALVLHGNWIYFLLNIFKAKYISGPIPHHCDGPRFHLHPGPDVSWQVIIYKKLNFDLKYWVSHFPPGNSVFYYLGHFISPQHSRVLSKLLIYRYNFI